MQGSCLEHTFPHEQEQLVNRNVMRVVDVSRYEGNQVRGKEKCWFVFTKPSVLNPVIMLVISFFMCSMKVALLCSINSNYDRPTQTINLIREINPMLIHLRNAVYISYHETQSPSKEE